jgi:hypothetical protein
MSPLRPGSCCCCRAVWLQRKFSLTRPPHMHHGRPRDDLTRGNRLARGGHAPSRVVQETQAVEDEEHRLLAELHRLDSDIERTEASLRAEVCPLFQPPVLLQSARPRRGGSRKQTGARTDRCTWAERCGWGAQEERRDRA